MLILAYTNMVADILRIIGTAIVTLRELSERVPQLGNGLNSPLEN